MKYISPTAPLLIIKREARETREPDLGLPKGLIFWSNRIPPVKKVMKCRLCSNKLTGKFIFDNDLCFVCVLEKHIKSFEEQDKRTLNRIAKTTNKASL